jgi:hypothetical protein
MYKRKPDIRIILLTLVRACYGRFSGYRIPRLGMQVLTELFQFKLHGPIKKEVSHL